VGQEEGSLALTEIASSFEYKSESEASTSTFLLSLHTLSLPTPLLPLSLPSSILSPSHYNMSQHSQVKYKFLAQQQQKQLAVLQVQIQVLLAAQGTASRVGEVARLQMFDGSSEKVPGFVTACKLYIRMKMRRVVVEEQIQWILSYIQRGLADIWKKNTLEDLEGDSLEYETAGEFFADIKRKFGGEDEETAKVVEIKGIEQRGKTMEEFV